MRPASARLPALLAAALLATLGCVGGGGGGGFGGGGRADPSGTPVPCSGRMLATAPTCEGDRLTAEERRLFDLINAWRAEHGRHAIPFSASLTLVANRHVRDLNDNIQQLGHSWTGCRYVVGNRSTYDCMWRAPQRLGTRYRGNGYENTYIRRGGVATPQAALERWKGSDLHNGVILNRMGGGIDWGRFTWRALGVGIYGNFAVMWVGDQTDPDRTPMSATAPRWLAVQLDDLSESPR